MYARESGSFVPAGLTRVDDPGPGMRLFQVANKAFCDGDWMDGRRRWMMMKKDVCSVELLQRLAEARRGEWRDGFLSILPRDTEDCGQKSRQERRRRITRMCGQRVLAGRLGSPCPTDGDHETVVARHRWNDGLDCDFGWRCVCINAIRERFHGPYSVYIAVHSSP